MPNSSHGKGPASMQDGDHGFNQPWIAFFAQVKKLAAKLDEMEQVETEKAEERQF